MASAEDVGDPRLGAPVLVPQNMFARLLYTNPVCLLTTSRGAQAATAGSEVGNTAAAAAAMTDVPPQAGAGEEPKAAVGSERPAVNVMTISWLTPTTNVAVCHGGPE